VTLPKGTKAAIDDRDFTVATIVAPSAMKSEEGDTSTEAGDVPTVGEDGEEVEGGETAAPEGESDKG
jgi:large subunit ribosomal protein L25